MPDTFEAVQALRGEMVARVEAVSNELHRHQDVYRQDLLVTTNDIRDLKTTQDNIHGGFAAIRLVVGIPAFIAAAASLMQLIRHW